MAQVMFKTDIKGNLDETDIIDAICHDSDTDRAICSESERKLLNFFGYSLSERIESVNLATLKYVKSFDYEDVYMVSVKVKQFDIPDEDIYKKVKNARYFHKLCKIFDDNNIEYDKLDIADIFYYPLRNVDTSQEFMESVIENIRDCCFEDDNSIKFVVKHKKEILNSVESFKDELDELNDYDDWF